MEQSRSKINASRYFIKETVQTKQNTFYTILGEGGGNSLVVFCLFASYLL